LTTADDIALQFAFERGLVPAESLEAARHAVDRRTVAEIVATQLGMPFVTIGERRIAAGVLGALPRSFVLRHGVCAVAETDGAIQVAVPDPFDVDVLDSLAHVCERRVVPVVALSDDLQQAIARHYAREADQLEDLTGGAGEAASALPAPAASPSDPLEGDAPIIRRVHAIIEEAVRRRASDIHLEPLERRFRVRYRIDGAMVEVDSPPKQLHLALVSRVKLMANISIAEKRVPQDGRIQVVLAGRPFDLRVSSLPTAHGESIVMRLLDQEGLRPGLAELGFSREDEAVFSRLIFAPDGMVLVTGPTGSGKTTTLYASLHHLNRPERKIITVEDPVEYQLTGINQVPVRAEIDMTFAAALRAMLRQAPNVVMVGEIRDAETADVAINAALTGHLVFSTLHTNDAPGAVTRLVDIGTKPFLIAAALRATVAQRLVRRVCPDCAQDYAPTARELLALGVPAERLAGARFRRGVGCAACYGTGYRGRMGIFEIFLISEEIRALIYESASAARLRACARREGMRTMREDGVRKVLAGLTTIEEVVSVTVGDLD